MPALERVIAACGYQNPSEAVKMPACQKLESVCEIMLIDADSFHAELYRRKNDHSGIELVREAEAVLSLVSVDVRILTSERYQGIAVPAPTISF
jgi:hypothetical protein